MADRPDFIERDPATIETEALSTFEAALGKALFPGQPERLLLNGLVYREALVRMGIQYAAEQSLVNYAVEASLDQLGVLLGVTRLEAAAARVTMRFSRTALPSSLLIPQGTRVGVSGSGIRFATVEAATILANQATVDVIAEALSPGTAGNGFTAGQVNELIDAIAGVTSAANITTSNGGSDTETDDRLRTRIKLAPNQFSVAGSKGAYRYWALTADPNVIDVAVVGPEDRGGLSPVLVQVYPLTSTGLPSTEILTAVEDVLSNDTIRPLTDEVDVIAPTAVTYSITASITLYSTADAATLTTQLNAAAQAFAVTKRAKLGQDIIRSQLTAALSLEGVYQVNLTSPATDQVISPSQWANCTAITITIAGTNAG
ncbi:MAG TPA: baseplate J/gp47 family protein [Trichocoleus sp.]